MAPTASTSKLSRRNSKGKGKQSEREREPALISNTKNSLPQQDDYVPPAQKLNKYVYANPKMENKNFLKTKSIVCTNQTFGF